MIDELTSLEHIAALVSEALARAGINAVLSGGAVVSIYSENEFQSYDLDFITSHAMKEVVAPLAALGYVRGKGRHFTHPRTPYLIEFPPGPLMVGDQRVTRSHERETSMGVIRLLTPTDAVKDRLSAFFYWSDRQSLAQALAIARRQPVDLQDIERWALAEPMPAAERFGIFRNRLSEESL